MTITQIIRCFFLLAEKLLLSISRRQKEFRKPAGRTDFYSPLFLLMFEQKIFSHFHSPHEASFLPAPFLPVLMV